MNHDGHVDAVGNFRFLVPDTQRVRHDFITNNYPGEVTTISLAKIMQYSVWASDTMEKIYVLESGAIGGDKFLLHQTIRKKKL